MAESGCEHGPPSRWTTPLTLKLSKKQQCHFLDRSLGDHEATHLQSASCRGEGSWGGWGHLYAVIMWESPTKLCKEMKLINLRTRGLPLYQKYISVKRPESSACKECFAFSKRWNMSNVYCEIHFKMFAPSLASEASVKYNLE